MPLLLAIDDSEDQLLIYELLLGSEGYRVVCALDGDLGLSKLIELRPDLVLLDMMMPTMSGLEFLDRLRREVEHAPPILACSGFEPFEADARARGVVAFLRKPIRPPALLAAVASALAGSALPTASDADRQAEHARHDEVRRKVFASTVDRADLRQFFEQIATWLAGYLGRGTTFVTVLCDGRLYVQAAAGPDAAPFVDNTVDPRLVFCGNVLDAGSSLVLEDSAQHPYFKDHPEARAGFRFYAGCPLTLRRDTVLGTLCVLHRAPLPFSTEDMILVERTALVVARAIERCANGDDVHDPFAPETFRDLLRAALTSELLRVSRRGGAVGLAILTGYPRERLTAALDRIREHPLPGVAAGRAFPEAIALSLYCSDESQTRSILRRLTHDLERAVHVRTCFETIAATTDSADGLLARLEQAATGPASSERAG